MRSRAEASQLGRRDAPKDARRALAILPKREFATIRAYPDFGREKYRAAVRVLSSLGGLSPQEAASCLRVVEREQELMKEFPPEAKKQA
jgi:hypothetical protein